MDDEARPDADVPPAVTSEEAFREALRQLVIEADSNGVDVRGGWPVERSDTERAWELEIAEISRRSNTTIDDTEFPVSAVVDAVAEREEIDPTDLPPLYDAIGPDILEVLHEADAGGNQRVTFEYYGYRVTVNADGTITLDK